jgi:hypothetical protein
MRERLILNQRGRRKAGLAHHFANHMSEYSDDVEKLSDCTGLALSDALSWICKDTKVIAEGFVKFAGTVSPRNGLMVLKQAAVSRKNGENVILHGGPALVAVRDESTLVATNRMRTLGS